MQHLFFADEHPVVVARSFAVDAVVAAQFVVAAVAVWDFVGKHHAAVEERCFGAAVGAGQLLIAVFVQLVAEQLAVGAVVERRLTVAGVVGQLIAADAAVAIAVVVEQPLIVVVVIVVVDVAAVEQPFAAAVIDVVVGQPPFVAAATVVAVVEQLLVAVGAAVPVVAGQPLSAVDVAVAPVAVIVADFVVNEQPVSHFVGVDDLHQFFHKQERTCFCSSCYVFQTWILA